MITVVGENTCRTILLYTTLSFVCLLEVLQPINVVVRKKCVPLSFAVQLESRSRRFCRLTPRSKDLERKMDISFGWHFTTAPQAER